MTAWPPWRRDDPTQLLRYVQPGALATVLPPGSRPPGRSGAPPEVRLRQVFAAFAAADVRYADEELGVGGEQDIRPPDQIFTRPGVANCLDLAVAFAGGCLDAGLHPMVVTLTPVSGGVRHAIVVVWLRGDLDAPDYPLAEVVAAREPAWPGMGLRASWEAAGEFVAVDVARVARGWPDPEAQPELGLAVAAAGAMLTDNAWSWEVGVDVGIEHRSVEGYPLPRRPTVVPLEEPYHADARADTGSPLESVRARNRVVPFEPRGELDTIEDWCLAPADEPGRLRLVLVHGVGGAGKTRLAAELAHRLIDRERWYGGFLRRDLTRRRTDPDDPLPDIAWLAEVIGPLLVVVDYVEQADPATLAGHLKVLAGRRWPTVVLLTARFPGDWRRELDNALGSRGVVPESFPDIRLDAHHPRMEVVYRRSYRRFAPASGAPDTPPDLPPAHRRWTTLDVVMLGWLAARFPQSGPPADRATLYERILDREFANWNAFLAEKYHREADVTALRRAAAVVSLLSPATSEATIAALRAGELAELSSLAPGELAGLLRRFLSDPEEGGLALRPDPLADHLITRTFAPNELFDQCTDVAAGTGDSPDLTGIGRLVVNVTRAADSDAGLAGALADRILRRHPQWWPVALGVTWTQGGPFVRPLERLAEREDTPLPLAELAERVPLGHGALPRLALIAADHVARQQTSDVDDHEALDRAARALNNLSNRQAEAGDRASALTSITKAVTAYRRLAEANPDAFLPDLAMSLNNLSGRQAEAGDRAGALTSITEAVTAYRRLAEANPAAFLPNLAMSLNNLSLRQAEAGDRASALTSITEAVTIRRRLAEANPAAFLPDLATSLNNLSNRQAEAGDRANALTSITEAVTIRRRLADTNPAAFLPDLATSLTTRADLMVGEPGGVAAAVTAWDDATDQLPPPVRARLLAYRGRWHHDRGDAAATRDDLLRAARLVDGDTPPGDPTQVSLARQHVRAVLATAHQPGDDFPDWATRPVPDQLIERANAWMTGDWPARRRMLTDQERPVDRDALRVLAALYRDRPALDEWLALLAAIDSAGAEAVLADMDALAAATNLVEEWIATPSWNASQAFLAAHHGLRDPVARAVLERASGDPVARQHLAILRLVDHVSPGAVFDAILDPADARELLFTLARRGASQDLAELLFATARIAADPFAAPLALALYLALDAEPDEGAGTIDDAVAAAVTAASARDRREALELLTALTRIRDDRAAILARIAAAFRNHTAS